MKSLHLTEILPHLGGVIVSGKKQQLITHVSVHHRKIKGNTMYFKFRQRDISSRFRDKPKVIVTDDLSSLGKVSKKVTIVKVEDVNEAYWNFIRYYRSLFKVRVIGVTGTSGKTSTTEMLKKVLRNKYYVTATRNGNNALALNLPYLLRFNNRTQAAVFEMGVSRPGCVRNYCRYFQPEVGIILNIGTYHLLGCGTLEEYIKAKAEMLEGINNKGTLIINADDENIKKIDFSQFKGKLVKIGLNSDCHYRAKDLQYTERGMSFKLVKGKKTYSAFVPGYGEHNVYNGLAVIAAAFAVGIPIKATIEYLAQYKPMRKHLQFRKGINEGTIIDDTWNCTPPAAEAALKVLESMAKGREKVAVMGYMPQLGENGQHEYAKTGEKVVKAGVDYLIVIGDEAKDIGLKAIEVGMDKEKVFFCDTGDQLFNVLKPLMNKKTLVLFKFPYKYRLRKIASFNKFMEDIIDWEA